jgi:hypothetical protein
VSIFGGPMRKQPKVVPFLAAIDGLAKIGYNFWQPKETTENIYIFSGYSENVEYIRGCRKMVFSCSASTLYPYHNDKYWDNHQACPLHQL